MDRSPQSNQVFRGVRPTEVRSDLVLPEFVIRNENVFDFDSFHALLVDDDRFFQQSVFRVHVFLHGTGCTPLTYNSATSWLQASAELGIPSIGLSYQWANWSDSERNNIISGLGLTPEQSQLMLEQFHRCFVAGGSMEGLCSVAYYNSIFGRLTDLIQYLASHHKYSLFWKQLLLRDGQSVNFDENVLSENYPGVYTLNYNRFVFSGHSQGSGHVAYIAKQYPLHRAIFVSGPQELLSTYDIDGNAVAISWLQGRFETRELRAVANVNEELTASLIRKNWNLMQPLNDGRCFIFSHIDMHISNIDEVRCPCVSCIIDHIRCEEEYQYYNSTSTGLFSAVSVGEDETITPVTPKRYLIDFPACTCSRTAPNSLENGDQYFDVGITHDICCARPLHNSTLIDAYVWKLNSYALRYGNQNLLSLYLGIFSSLETSEKMRSITRCTPYSSTSSTNEDRNSSTTAGDSFVVPVCKAIGLWEALLLH
jgi:hypothetical protein